MAHLYKLTEWQDGVGNWHCGDVEDLAHDSNYWYNACRLYDLTPVDYVKMLLSTFNVTKISYNLEKDVLLFSWKSQTDMRKFKNQTNALARKKNFMV